MPTEPTNPIETEPDPKDIAFIEDRIIEFNYAETGIRDGELLAIFQRAENNAITAGIYGWTWGGVCEIRFLWVQSERRRQGTGKQLLAQAEQEARRRGCHKITLNTHSFQAPNFYQKYGYQIIGVVDDYPRGYQNIFLQKILD